MKKLTLVLLFALVVFISSVALAYAQAYGPVFTVLYNIDLPGSEIKPVFAADLGSCINDCAFSSECRAFTWVDVNQQPGDYNNDSPLCWIKGAVPDRRQGSGMVSGIKRN